MLTLLQADPLRELLGTSMPPGRPGGGGAGGDEAETGDDSEEEESET